MKKIVFLFYCIIILFLTCTRFKVDTDIVNNEVVSITITEELAIESDISLIKPKDKKRQIDERRDMFFGLFDDIKDDNPYEWGDDFTVKLEKVDNPYGDVSEYYILENEEIKIFFYNHLEVYISREIKEKREAQGKRLTGWLPLRVFLNKNTNKYQLGNYIGKNIDEVLKNFDNQYIRDAGFTYGEGITVYIFDLRSAETNSSIMRVVFYTFDNIITRIRCGYEFQ